MMSEDPLHDTFKVDMRQQCPSITPQQNFNCKALNRFHWNRRKKTQEEYDEEYVARVKERGEADPDDFVQPGQVDSFFETNPLERLTLSTMCLNINDIVRGSVICAGPEEMVGALKTLEGNPTVNGITFSIKRIKNTHHKEAANVGGYRDVKVIGALAAADGACMLVEIQIIDSEFVGFKKYMHRLYGLWRGDFSVLPVEGVVYDGTDFADRNDILTVLVPEGTTEIKDKAFMECKTLMAVDFPKSLKTVKESAFKDCPSLLEAELPEHLKKLEHNAFAGCVGLNKVSLPAGMEDVCDSSFGG